MSNYQLDDEELFTIIAALRYYQEAGMGEPANRSEWIHNLAVGGDYDNITSLDADAIDELVERLNTGDNTEIKVPEATLDFGMWSQLMHGYSMPQYTMGYGIHVVATLSYHDGKLIQWRAFMGAHVDVPQFSRHDLTTWVRDYGNSLPPKLAQAFFPSLPLKMYRQ